MSGLIPWCTVVPSAKVMVLPPLPPTTFTYRFSTEDEPWKRSQALVFDVEA
jgi:hypothetical protein